MYASYDISHRMYAKHQFTACGMLPVWYATGTVLRIPKYGKL
jgi:hypothetical protein